MLEADGAGAGERDRVDARVRDEGRAHVALAREQVQRGRGHTGRVEGLDDGERTRGGLLRGLEHDAVAGREAGGDHPGGDRQAGSSTGPTTATTPRGRVAERVALARELDEPVAGLERDRLLRVVLEEVDRLADVGVGLVPRLAAFADGQGGELRGVGCAALRRRATGSRARACAPLSSQAGAACAAAWTAASTSCSVATVACATTRSGVPGSTRREGRVVAAARRRRSPARATAALVQRGEGRR